MNSCRWICITIELRTQPLQGGNSEKKFLYFSANVTNISYRGTSNIWEWFTFIWIHLYISSQPLRGIAWKEWVIPIKLHYHFSRKIFHCYCLMKLNKRKFWSAIGRMLKRCIVSLFLFILFWSTQLGFIIKILWIDESQI